MEIILVVSDKKGKNILFVLDNLQAVTLKEAIGKICKGEISGVHLVETSRGIYLRTKPNAQNEDNLDALSISLSALTRTSKTEKTTKAVSRYSRCRQRYLKRCEAASQKVIQINGRSVKTEQEIIDYLTLYKKEILTAARALKVDASLLGAILIDEDLRRDWIDDWSDWLAILGRNRSVGIAQVKISTAKDLVRREFYPADSAAKGISPKNIDKISGWALHRYLESAEHSILFAAAKINQIESDFAAIYDINRLEVVADLYSRKDLRSTGGKVTSRGKQIAGEFYKIAKKALQ